MTLFEGVFATILFDMALFGTDNVIINGIISLFTSIQNSWDRSFVNEDIASTKVTDFCNRLNIQQEPWIWEKRKEEYTSLNDFFSRTYDSKYFPPIGSGRLVSPACCTIQCYNNDSDMKTVLIKGCDYEIGKIGLPEDDLEKYRMNKILIGYLSPKDYHRVHSPISVSALCLFYVPSFLPNTHCLVQGKVVHCKMEGINAPSASVKFFEGQFNLLNNNKRLVIVIEEKDDDDGSIDPLRVAIAIIGGVGVNTITYGDIMGKEVKKGDELSTFRAGGR